MPGAFNNSRRGSLSEHRVAKYLLYAVGEVFLIFIGITLAVGFENAAERERQAELADGLLLGVRQDLVANIAHLEENIEIDENFLASLTRVIDFLDSSDPEWTDSLGVELETALHWSSPFPATSGYEGLKQAGLYRVGDEELRAAIGRLFEQTYGFLVGDRDRAMWSFMEASVYPLYESELRRVDSGGTARGRWAPRDLVAIRESGRLRTVLLEQQAFLIAGLGDRRKAHAETRAVLEMIDEAIGSPPPAPNGVGPDE